MANEFIVRTGLKVTGSAQISSSLTVADLAAGSGKVLSIGTGGKLESSGYSLNQDLNTTSTPTFTGVTVSSLTVNGTASIAYLTTVFESASVIYSSGSNIFGDASSDTQTLYGTINVMTGPTNFTGSVISQAGYTGSLLGTASYAINALSSSYALSASYAANVPATASYALQALTASFAQTASSINPLVQNVIVTGSVLVTGSITTTSDSTFNSIVVGRGAGNNIESIRLGPNALYSNTTGDRNIAIGRYALALNTNGTRNIGIGVSALEYNGKGEFNTALGHYSNNQANSGSGNTSIGSYSLPLDFSLSSSYNTAVGYDAAGALLSGNYNTYLGVSAYGHRNGSSNTIIGARISNNAAGTQTINNTVMVADGAGSVRFYSPSSSNVLFGGFTDSGEKLQVSGSARINGNIVLSGSVQQTILNKQQSTSVSSITTVSELSVTNVDAVFFDYVIKNATTDLRAGTVMAVTNGSTVEYTETSTADIGNTSGVTLSVDLNSGNIRLRATATSGTWTVRAFARTI